jgi:hypothetical protein
LIYFLLLQTLMKQEGSILKKKLCMFNKPA